MYLFTTATITVFSEELTALIDLNVNRGSLFSKQARRLEKPVASNQCIFSFSRSDSHRQAEPRGGALRAVPRPLKECSVQGRSSACGFPQPVVIKAL